MPHASGKPNENVRVEFRADFSHLARGDRAALPYLVDAVKLIDRAYLLQMRQNIHAIYAGKSFDKSKQPDFYPDGATREGIEEFLDSNPDAREAILNPFTAVVRDHQRGLKAIPYSEHFEDFRSIAYHLKEAARYVAYRPFAKFLKLRARAFRTNEYRESDVAWVKCVGGQLELIIGPFEDYEDKLYAVKRDLEGYLCVVLEKETAEARLFEKTIADFDAHLGARFGYTSTTSTAPVTFVDQIIVGGSPLYRYTTMASNLPNETDIHREVGSKKTLFNNMMRAKFENLSKPIAERVLGEVPRWYTYYTYRLLVVGHEASHGISFHFDGSDFGPPSPTIEEIKADVFGLLYLYFLEEAGKVKVGTGDSAMMIHVVDGLRQMHFDIEEAHAVGAIVQLNHFLKSGAVTIFDGRLRFTPEKFRQSLDELGATLYQLSQTKDGALAKRFLEETAQPSGEIQVMLDGIKDLPKDIDPVYLP